MSFPTKRCYTQTAQKFAKMLQKILPLPVSNLQKQTWLGLSSRFFIDLALDDSHLVLVRNVETRAQYRP